MILTPELVVLAYSQGYFPMADDVGAIEWHSPYRRAIIPLDAPVPRSARKLADSGAFEFRINTAFRAVMQGCADREETWISDEIVDVYTALHEQGIAHSVESWAEGELVGGLYGLALNGAFFGEAMFSRRSGASKAAFVALKRRLVERGFQLLDSQYINDHMKMLGACEVSRVVFKRMLDAALNTRCTFV